MTIVMRTMLRAAFLGTVALATPVLADEVIVTQDSTAWRNLPAELREDATAGITDTVGRSGNGSLELTGPRTRFAIGNIYSRADDRSLALLSDVTALTFDWRIAGDSSNPYNPDYTPALRLHIWDAGAGVRREIIWEGAYNNVYGPQTSADQWYSTSATDRFYVGAGNENSGVTIAQWASSFAAGSFVTAISVGSGGGAGDYHAFADNVTLATGTGSTTYNFEVAAVPEPASWALMLTGFGLVGATMRRRRIRVAFGA
jgi:hypothetical protein